MDNISKKTNTGRVTVELRRKKSKPNIKPTRKNLSNTTITFKNYSLLISQPQIKRKEAMIEVSKESYIQGSNDAHEIIKTQNNGSEDI